MLWVFAPSLTSRADRQADQYENQNIVRERGVVDITGKTALVTGANRGLGRHLAAELRDRGVRVYAAARDPQAVDLAGVTPIALDITDPASVAAAAQGVSGWRSWSTTRARQPDPRC